MRNVSPEIVPMKRVHVRDCDSISAASEPWKTLHEGIDFLKYISLRQAYVCEIGSKTAGFIIFTPEPVFARGGYVRAVGVAPEVRRQGIGKKLLAFAERIM